MRIGLALLLCSLIAAVVLVTLLVTTGVRQPFASLMGGGIVVSFTTGMLLRVLSPHPVTTARVAAWSVPGLAITVYWSLIFSANWFELVLPLPEAATLVGMACGPISLFTSAAATVLVVRSRSQVGVILCAGSWLGALMFWVNALRMFPGQ